MKPKYLFLMDATFGADKSWRQEFFEGLLRKKHDVIFDIQTRFEILEQKDLDLMSELNILALMGVDSASSEMLRIMNRAVNPRKYLQRLSEMLNYASKTGTNLLLSLVFNHPGETPETYKETIAFLESLARGLPQSTFFPSAVPFALSPGSYIFNNPSYYENAFGSRFPEKQWWKSSPEEMCTKAWSVIASRRTECEFGSDFGYWQKDYEDMRKCVEQKQSAKSKLDNFIRGRLLSANYRRWQKNHRTEGGSSTETQPIATSSRIGGFE
jgi:radical SAM superfamily enzyme YgiQ (UPF0313 family)